MDTRMRISGKAWSTRNAKNDLRLSPALLLRIKVQMASALPLLRDDAHPPLNRSPEVSDLAVIDAIAGGNRELFEVIVRRYNPQLYRVGMCYLRDHAQAEDAMQNAYLKAFVNLGRFRRGSAFATWLRRIMINECLMQLRRRRTPAGAPPLAELVPFETPSSDRSAAETLTLQESKHLLERAIAALPRQHRAVYLLREVQHLSVADTAATLRISTDNVKACLHRARERLKRELLKSAAGAELFAYPASHCDPLTARVLQRVTGL